MMRAIGIINQQTTAVQQIVRSPTWSVEAGFNYPGYGYPVNLSPELQVRQPVPLVEQNAQQQMAPNPVLFGAVPPCVVPVSPTVQPVAMFDTESDLFPLSGATFVAKNFVEGLINMGKLESYATDKRGSRLLQRIFTNGNEYIRQTFFNYFLKKEVFLRLCDDVYANFLLQKMMEEAGSTEHDWIRSLLETDLVQFSRGRFACRVVQKALECFDTIKCLSLVSKLDGAAMLLSLDQNGNHVIQKVLMSVPFCGYSCIVSKFAASKDGLREIVQDRYGCRVIQLSIQKLEEETLKQCVAANTLLDKLISILLEDCSFYATHQFANYVIQHIITSNTLDKPRNVIICQLLNSLLTLSQEKYSSHVVEKAFNHAPPKLLSAMMNEIFDGYECDSEGNDAIDALLFDQFGNYVIQTMLEIAIQTWEQKREGSNSWFDRLTEKIVRNQDKLMRYSSGKRILGRLSAAVLNKAAVDQDENINPVFKSLVVPEKFR